MENTLQGNKFPLSSYQRAFPLKFSDVQLSHGFILEAEMRTDPASSAGGDTDLHRMQLRL